MISFSVCAAKVSEAELLAKAGIKGILLTGPIASTGKIKKIIEILSICPSLIVTVDHRDEIDNLNLALQQENLSIDVLIDIDAGLKTLYKDGAVPQILTEEFVNMKYDWFGDEYGKIIYTENSKAPTLGTVIEVITSHCDPTINLFDKFYITKGEHFGK
ncbi:MAG: alanine racemase [Bacteroidetes bacterium]|nr:alanine racemase [Bacteroidota bacterium]